MTSLADVFDETCPEAHWLTENDALSNYSFLFPFENWRERSEYVLWQYQNWTIGLWGTAIYVLGIVFLGQKLMSYREKGFELRTAMVIWNVCSAIFSVVGFWRTSQELFRVWSRHGFQHSVCVSSYAQDAVFCFWIKMFIFSKFVEFSDTLFLVLRKKPVSFLHWYHHATVLAFCWHGAKTMTAAGRWFCWMNYGVHAVIYVYFAWRTSGYTCPKWVSMCVTGAQMSQMVVGCVIGYVVWTIKANGGQCHQRWSNLYMALGIYSTFFLLFSHYFYVNYIKKRGKRLPSESSASKKSSRDENQNVKELSNNQFENAKIRYRNIGQVINQ